MGFYCGGRTGVGGLLTGGIGVCVCVGGLECGLLVFFGCVCGLGFYYWFSFCLFSLWGGF